MRSAKSAKDEAAVAAVGQATRRRAGQMRRRRHANGCLARTTKDRAAKPGGQGRAGNRRGRPHGRNRKRRQSMPGATNPPRNCRHERKILEAQKKIVDAMEDSEEKARRQESIGNHLSQIETARARMKQGEAKTEEERTQALADKLKEVESQIKDLTDAPAKIKIEADIQQAIDGINTTLVALGSCRTRR